MSDLISRSEVNDVIDELEVYTCGRPNTMKVEVSVLQLQRFINKLKNIPTAYDIDKVVKEFEENASRYTKKYTTPYGNNGYKDTKAISVHKAIEIVKQGGVSDDVCEKDKDGGVMYSTEEYKGCRNCKYQPEPMQTCDWIKHQKEVYRVCPMWELKKIKVVE